jgi:hypothetical protein
VRWALVRPDGGIAAQSGGITLAAKPGTGQYILCFSSGAVTGRPILASSAYAADISDQRGAITAGPCGGGAEGRACATSDNSSVFVATRDENGATADRAFYVAVIG